MVWPPWVDGWWKMAANGIQNVAKRKHDHIHDVCGWLIWHLMLEWTNYKSTTFEKVNIFFHFDGWHENATDRIIKKESTKPRSMKLGRRQTPRINEEQQKNGENIWCRSEGAVSSFQALVVPISSPTYISHIRFRALPRRRNETYN